MTLPILGVAVRLDDLEDQLSLVRDHERDVELQDFISAETLSGEWQPLVARAQQLLGDHQGRVGIHGPFYGFDLATTDPDVATVVATRLAQALDVVEALAMREPHIVIHAPGSIWDYHNTAVSPEAARRRTEAFVANVAPAATRAETVGATFVLENIQDPDPAMRRRLVEAVGSPALRLSLDTGHANYGHGRFGTPPPDAFVRDAGNALAHLHLQDTDGYADRHWALGEGNIAWPALFRALRTSTGLGNGGADAPRLIIELADKAGLASSIAHLRALGVAQ